MEKVKFTGGLFFVENCKSHVNINFKSLDGRDSTKLLNLADKFHEKYDLDKIKYGVRSLSSENFLLDKKTFQTLINTLMILNTRVKENSAVFSQILEETLENMGYINAGSELISNVFTDRLKTFLDICEIRETGKSIKKFKDPVMVELTEVTDRDAYYEEFKSLNRSKKSALRIIIDRASLRDENIITQYPALQSTGYLVEYTNIITNKAVMLNINPRNICATYDDNKKFSTLFMRQIKVRTLPNTI